MEMTDKGERELSNGSREEGDEKKEQGERNRCNIEWLGNRLKD